MIRKFIGRNADNDLVLDHPSVAPRHAKLELALDGTLFVSSFSPEAPIALRRGERTLVAQRVSLCVDDRIIFGGKEVELSKLSTLFGPLAGARLRHRKEPEVREHATSPGSDREAGRSPSPRRNPATGAIEN